MTKVEKLEHEIKSLNHQELSSFRQWFFSFDADEWDHQIANDIKAGKLDAMASVAIKAHKEGRSREL